MIDAKLAASPIVPSIPRLHCPHSCTRGRAQNLPNHRQSVSSTLSDGIKLIISDIRAAVAATVAGIAGAVFPPVAPIVVPTVFAGMALAGWLYQVYKNT